MNEPLAALIERCRTRDEDAMAELVRRFRTWALDLASALLDDASLAEDAVQEAFTTALLRLKDLRDPLAFPGWLRQIVRTEVNRLLRKRREVCLDDESQRRQAGPAMTEPERNDLREHVREVIRGLPPLMRDATELFYLEERSCSEIAAMLRIPQGTVKRRLHDARQRLHGVLAESLDVTADLAGLETNSKSMPTHKGGVGRKGEAP
jgi:RNA polymerase sigma factor (sigma-70 family)